MELLLPLIFVAISTLVNSPEILCSSDSIELTTRSYFYDSFLPENIDQVSQSASNIHDLEPDLSASEDYEDDDEVKIHKETGHDDKNKKKYKIKKNFHYSK